MDVKKIIAACCSGAAVLLMLALPVLRISAMDRSLLALSGADLLSEGAIS